MHKLFIIILFLMSPMIIWAQNDEPMPEPPRINIEKGEDVVVTPERYVKRNYSESRLDELRTQKEFQYDKINTQKIDYRYRTDQDIQEENERQQKGAGGNENGSTYEQKKQNRRESRPVSNEKLPSQSINLSWLLYLLLALGIILIVLYLLGFRANNLFGKNKANLQNQSTAALDENDINQIKFETELEKAIRLKNYKLAVRILYLESLKMLNDQQFIQWNKDKTNWDFVREIKREDLKPLFKKITNSFDYVWYGDFAIDESTFRLMQDQINLFKTKI